MVKNMFAARRRALIRLLFFAFTVLLPFSFCASVSAEDIIMGYPSRSMTELPNYLAIKKGFYREEGLEAKFVQAKSNILVAALASGSIDYITSVTSSIGGILAGIPAKVVAGVVKNNPDFLVARPEIGTIQDLRGKKLAVSGFGGASHQRLVMILRKAGLDPESDVHILSVGEAPLRLQQLRLGVISATVLTAPNNIMAERAGFVTLGSSKDILALPAVGIATLARRLKEKPEQVKKVLRALLKGMQYIREQRAETARVAMEWLSVDRDLAERSLDVMISNYSFDCGIDLAGLKAMIEVISKARERGALKKSLSPSDVVDFSLLEEVRKEMRGYDRR
jgi:NitT/TauT family transport system substrate-binding protein